MSVDLVQCPSGLEGRIRRMKVKELELLANVRAMRNGDALQQIIESCWVETTNEGPAYAKGRFTWEDALQGDYVKALIEVRRLTHGDELDLDVQCAHCRAKFSNTILLSEMRTQAYPAASLEQHRKGVDFTLTVAGRKATYKLVTRRIERQLGKKLKEANGKDVITTSLAYRLLTVEGLEKEEIHRWLGDQDASVLGELQAAFDEHSGGVHTTVDAECDNCAGVTETQLPFVSPAFWLPKSRGGRKGSSPGSPQKQPETKAGETTSSTS